MNDTMMLALLGAIGSLVAILTPIIKVTSSITEIKAILTRFENEYKDNHAKLEHRVDLHGEEIDELKDITTKHEVRIENLEKGEER